MCLSIAIKNIKELSISFLMSQVCCQCCSQSAGNQIILSLSCPGATSDAVLPVTVIVFGTLLASHVVAPASSSAALLPDHHFIFNTSCSLSMVKPLVVNHMSQVRAIQH